MTEPTNGYAKGRRTRQRILDEAMGLFGERGFHSASLREIAARCGTTHASLLYHFGSKEELLFRVLEQRDALDAHFFAESEHSASAGLDALLAVVAHNAEVPGLVEVFVTLSAEGTSPDHPAFAFFKERYATNRASLTAVFAALAEEGRLAPGLAPESAAARTIALMDGFQVQWLLDRGSIDMADELRACLREMAPGWTPRALADLGSNQPQPPAPATGDGRPSS